jgi:hypothetical protein
MARENQGLQIALIGFVLLTIILSVTTFIFFSQYKEVGKKAATNEQEAAKAMNAARAMSTDTEELKHMMGFPPTDSIDAIQNQFNDDMKKYAGNFPEDMQFYRQTLERQFIVINEKNQSLDGELATVQKMKDHNEKREEVTVSRIEPFQKEAESAHEDKEAELAKFESERQRMRADQGKLAGDLQRFQKEHDLAISGMQTRIDKISKDLHTTTTIADRATDKLAAILRKDPEKFQGDVRWVNQRNKTVWINLGRADALMPQTTFSIYAPDILDMAQTGDKAKIEVTQILGDHLAEARITDDRASDPILPGDKIHTPVWSPGEKRHFALAGFIDLDKDGRSDLARMHTLIKMNGGEVDAPRDAEGKRAGKMTIDTRYLVVGETPDASSTEQEQQDYTLMEGQAEQLGVERISLGKFLDRMGWKSQSRLARFGGGHADDFPVRPNERPPNPSGKKISDLFKPREPLRSSGGSTY